MIDAQRPYLIIPKLILQPTWGGTYIINSKGLGNNADYLAFPIGQTYELFSGSKLLTNIYDTSSPEYLPELGNPNDDVTIMNNPLFYAGDAHLVLNDLVNAHKESFVGPVIWEQYNKMPLLIKLNQSRGNSFQLHLKSGAKDDRWQPKPESWYYFEDGRITYGLKPGTDLKAYKQTCFEIANFMQQLSQAVISGQKDLETARNEARLFIKKADPWQFVNTVDVKKDSVVDLSSGGIHHSWEEESELYPDGNIVYEVQHDVMDPVCTIRAFDQGKIKDNGSIREIHIEDYFAYLDTDERVNSPQEAIQEPKGNNLLTTPYYCLDKYDISKELQIKILDSFEHIYVKSGKITIKTNDTSLTLGAGHSAFIPYAVGTYSIVPSISSTVLRTYISAK